MLFGSEQLSAIVGYLILKQACIREVLVTWLQTETVYTCSPRLVLLGLPALGPRWLGCLCRCVPARCWPLCPHQAPPHPSCLAAGSPSLSLDFIKHPLFLMSHSPGECLGFFVLLECFFPKLEIKYEDRRPSVPKCLWFFYLLL